MKRRDFLFDHITRKDFIEDVMKSIAWTTLIGAVFSMSMLSLKAGSYFQGFGILILFFVLTLLSIFYVALHVFMPLDSAMLSDDEYWVSKLDGLSGVNKAIESLKVFLSKRSVIYMPCCLGYFLYAQEVSKYLASKL
jgi:hypothetical protein